MKRAPGERLEELGYYIWKALRLKQTDLSVREQARRIHLVADAYGVRVDSELMDAIDQAYHWMTEQGRREEWPAETIDQVEREHAWFREVRPNLSR